MRELVHQPVGLCILPERPANMARTVAYPATAEDTLVHYGVPHAVLDAGALADALPALRLLVTVGDATPDPDAAAALRAWIEDGGTWIGVGGVAGMPDLFGVEVDPPAYASWGGGIGTLGEGYLKPVSRHPATDHIRTPLHHFNGVPVRALPGTTVLADALDAHQRPTGRAALTEARAGRGRCILIAPDLTGSIVRIRQGIGITRDGVPASDGTAPICDAVLKSGDGFVLDWDFDRQDVPGVPGYRAFLEPQADHWAELLIRSLLYAAHAAQLRLPLLWLYPRDLPALAVLSHDSDGNDPDRARAMLDVVRSAGIRSTWCVQCPGYPPDVIEAIREAGSELAMHYDAMSGDAVWSADTFDRQYRELTGLMGAPPATNKNHYLRWEGDIEFFEWCAEHGIRLDQSKGASKTGEAGYNFGTCHPYLPVRRDGSVIPVYELATPTQDLIVFAPPALAAALTDSVLRTHGVLHLLFHPAHIATAGVADALAGAVRRAQESGMEWWTARELADWEDARRSVQWLRLSEPDSSACVELTAGKPLPDATVLWLDPDGDTERFGFRFSACPQTIPAGELTRMEVPR
jgi:hypothetical protein